MLWADSFVGPRNGAGFDVRQGGCDELVADGFELGGGGWVLEDAAADADHDALQHEGDRFGGGGEGLGSGGEHFNDGFRAARAVLLADSGAVDVGADGVEGRGGFGVAHLGGEEGGDEGGDALAEGLAVLLEADTLDFPGDVFEVESEGGLQEGALVREVLVERADGDSGAGGD